ncbi:hypothetical protein F5B22DRAFT_561632 [Xylaria bambusicola]|uniref:uncharacterized protein n=1 Tax=Xylaria bambusicola TaxID=326684 RepID=UPI0020073647|nr:uncharacterized protein F5B22DRAFT_561632 [Xylaria bambusicola]KAI0503178.1 hypothetical protein F5B22DRAFT_561632 [Xylaria bambusicola]
MNSISSRSPSRIRSLELTVERKLGESKRLVPPSAPDWYRSTKPSKSLESDSVPLSQSERKPFLRQSLFRWKWEILGMLLSLASLTALIILLAVQDGRRMDSWTTLFTLNTFVSVLAQTSRTSLAFGVGSSLGQAKWNLFNRRPGNLVQFEAFDEASKGLWGSLSLMYRLHSR